MSVVLMYHALHPDNDLSAIDVEDQPYAVSVSTFETHMALLQEYSVGLLSDNPSDTQPDVVLTFDDGHVSNLELALPVLQRYNLSAYFFVTTDFIESRDNHCRPEQLKAFTDAGMVVGSHGQTHQFLADLSDEAATAELVNSRRTLESWLDQPVTTISYPGGRYTKHTMAAAREAGYRQIFDSRFAPVSATDLASTDALPRVAIRRSTTDDEFESMIKKSPSYYRQVQRTQWFKQSVKRVLGNRLYHGLYRSISAR